MNTRERCMRVLHYKDVDRLPAVHFGYWKELLQEWAAQGHISAELADAAKGDSSPGQRELDKILGWDCNWSNNVSGKMGLYPPFEKKVLEVLPDGSHRVQTAKGVIERIKPGIVSIPSEDDYLLKDRNAFEELFADIVDTYAEMQYKVVEAMLATGLHFDFGHYWEDICFKNGPLLSPVLFEELCAKHYKRRNELCRKYGIDIISLDCDGVTDKLIPTWIENGVNVLFPIEIGTWGDQFEAARKQYGERLLGVGGMDKTALRKDKAAVDAELERLKRLVAMGGFIPCPDHRLMPGTKFELVQYYTEQIKSIRV